VKFDIEFEEMTRLEGIETDLDCDEPHNTQKDVGLSSAGYVWDRLATVDGLL
jgi:hypothetical protein